MRYHLTQIRMVIIKNSTNNKCWRGCGEKGTLLYCWWECELVQPLWRTVWRFLTKLKIELPYRQAILLQGTYPEKTMVWKVASLQRSLQHYLWHGSNLNVHPEEGIKEMWYIYSMKYYSAIKRNETMPFAATWTDLEIVILSEISQTEKGKHHMISLKCGIQKKKMIQMNWFTKKKQTYRHREPDLWLPMGKGCEGRTRLGVWDWHAHTTIYKIDKWWGPTV